jgi:hypothetical protein
MSVEITKTAAEIKILLSKSEALFIKHEGTDTFDFFLDFLIYELNYQYERYLKDKS